jgi:hypothetical protein
VTSRHGDRPIEGDDRRGVEGERFIVELEDVRPVSLLVLGADAWQAAMPASR